MDLTTKIFAVIFMICGITECIISIIMQDKFFAWVGIVLIVFAIILYLLRDEEL
jgi:membrane protein implicated in regulation of membrane protease activity